MKRLTLVFEDDAYKRLQQAVFVKRLAGDSVGAIEDIAIIIIQAIQNGDDVHVVQTRPPRKSTRQKAGNDAPPSHYKD